MIIGRKGLSDVITTVIIILIALVAVAIIGGIVIQNVQKTGGQVEAQTLCQSLDVQYSACDSTSTAADDGFATFSITRNSEAKPKGYVPIYLDSTGKVIGSGTEQTFPSGNQRFQTQTAVAAGTAKANTAKIQVLHTVEVGGQTYDCKVPTQPIDCT